MAFGRSPLTGRDYEYSDSAEVEALLLAQRANDPPPEPDTFEADYARAIRKREADYLARARERLPEFYWNPHKGDPLPPLTPEQKFEMQRWLLERLRQAPYNQERDPVPRQQAEWRSWFGETIAGRLLDAILDAEREPLFTGRLVRAWRVVQLLLACSATKNLWVSHGMPRADGELFDGSGNLYSCNRILCASCAANKSRRSRQKARRALKWVFPRVGEEWRFITLGSTRLKGVPVKRAIELHNAAFKLWRESDLYKDRIVGGIKSIEFTPPTEDEPGYNVHSHSLVVARWIDLFELARVWTDCLERVLRKAGLIHLLKYHANNCVWVGIKLVYLNRKAKRSARFNTLSAVDMETAIAETCKYITVPSDWKDVPLSDLIEIAEVKKWNRMFESLGECYGKLDTRKAPAEGEARGVPTVLDTPCVSDSSETMKTSPKTRPPPLLELPEDMPEEEWLRRLTVRVSRAQTLRRVSLAREYQSTQFETLAGDKWDYDSLMKPARREEGRRALDKAEWAERRAALRCPLCDGKLARGWHCPACDIKVAINL